MKKILAIFMLVLMCVSCSHEKTEVRGVVTKIDTIPERIVRRRVRYGSIYRYRTYKYPEHYVISYKTEITGTQKFDKETLDSITVNIGDTLIWFK
jgi:hypothetical protein